MALKNINKNKKMDLEKKLHEDFRYNDK